MKKLLLLLIISSNLVSAQISDQETYTEITVGAGKYISICELSRTSSYVYTASALRNVSDQWHYLRTTKTDTDGATTLVNVYGPWHKGTSGGGRVSIAKHPDAEFALVAYCNDDNDLCVVSIPIDDTGDITESLTDSVEYNLTGGASVCPQIISVSGNYFAVVYDEASKGRIGTFTCDTDGDLCASFVDDIEYDGYGYFPSICYVGNDWYAIGCSGITNFYGYLTSVDIDPANGDITDGSQLCFNSGQSWDVDVAVEQECVVCTYGSGSGYGLSVSSCILDTTDGSMSEIAQTTVFFKSSEVERVSAQKFIEGTDSTWAIAALIGTASSYNEGAWIGLLDIDPADGSMESNAFTDSLKYVAGINYDIANNIIQYDDRIIINTATSAFSVDSFSITGAEQDLPGGETTSIFGVSISLFGVAGLKFFGIE